MRPADENARTVIPQTQSQIRDLLAAHGLRPTRKLGQNFLIDKNLMASLVESADLSSSDTVLEVGAGTGSLTELLLEKAGHVVAVEIDRGLHGLLADRLGERSTLSLIHADVLRTKSRIDPRVLELLAASRKTLSGRCCLVANLPYSIASPLLADLILSDLPMSLACFTVQKEVADRIVAPPGGKEIGPLSVVLQAAASIERIASVPPQAFWPQPKVDSVMLRMVLHSEPGDLALLSRVVHACFLHRRKTLRSNIETAFGAEAVARATENTNIDLTRRPETLSVREWQILSGTISFASR